MKDIIIPSNAIKYILFQRTGYLKKDFLFKLLTRFGYFKAFYKFSVSLKCLFFSSKIKVEFTKDIRNDYLTIKAFLPQKIDSILDIGCGVAGIDILISNHYGNDIDVFLLDKTQVDDNVYYGFEREGSFYNSLQISKKLLELNGINSKRIYLQEATQDNKIKFENVNMAVSLFSWGFHYPISTYLDEVYKKLKTNGILISDIRKNTNGEKEIKDKFGHCKIIFESRKFIRVLAQKR